MKERIRAAGIVIYNNKILLMERRKNAKTFFVIPGGGVGKNETFEQAAIRELEEETTVKATPLTLLYTTDYLTTSKQYFFLCKYISGTPHLGDFNEKEAMETGEKWYKPQWISLEKLSSIYLYPEKIHKWLLRDIKNNFLQIPQSLAL